MISLVEIPIVADSSPGEAVAESAPDTAVLPAPKKRGRPKGAPNKPKQPVVIQEVPVAPSPKKKRATKAQPPSESDEEPPAPRVPSRKRARPRAPSSSDDEPALPKKRTTRGVPEPPNTQQLAAEVLQLLSSRHVGQANARRARYASWFA